MATINVRSISNRIAFFSDIVESEKLDAVSVTETWLTTKETSASLTEVTPRLVYTRPQTTQRTRGWRGHYDKQTYSKQQFRGRVL